MYWVVSPVAQSTLAKTALCGKSGRPVATDAAGFTNTTNTANTADASGPAHTARLAYTTDASYTTDAADTTDASGPAHTTDASYTTDAADSTDTANTSGSTHTTDAARDGIAIEAVVVIDINIAAAPAATPAPTAAPPRSHQHARAEGDRGACRVVAWRIGDRRIWIFRWTIYCSRLIRRYVHNFRIGRLDYNHAPIVNYARFHFLLFSTLQNAVVLRLLTHALNGIHHAALL
jgi:hypothetical protein